MGLLQGRLGGAGSRSKVYVGRLSYEHGGPCEGMRGYKRPTRSHRLRPLVAEGCSAGAEWSVSPTVAAIQFLFCFVHKGDVKSSRLARAVQSEFETACDLGPSQRLVERRTECLFELVQRLEAWSA